jgi:hypothetical protein
VWVLLAIAIAATLPVAASAYWTGTGSGDGTTVLPDVQSLTLERGIPAAQLYPGGEATVEVVATNPNATFVEIGSLALDPDRGVPFEVDGGHSGCNVSALSFTTQDNGGAGWQVPPRAGSTDGSLDIDLPAALKMNGAAANACQDATFTVHLKARP